MNRTLISNYQDNASATISASLSNAVLCGGLRLNGIITPNAWTTANLTFQVSIDGTNYNNLYDASGNEYTVIAAASRHILLDVRAFQSFTFLKVRSGTASTPVNQGADRVLTLLFGS